MINSCKVAWRPRSVWDDDEEEEERRSTFQATNSYRDVAYSTLFTKQNGNSSKKFCVFEFQN